MEADIILGFVNENPKKFLARIIGKRVRISEHDCIISRDMYGQLVVSCNYQVFKFIWDDQQATWLRA